MVEEEKELVEPVEDEFKGKSVIDVLDDGRLYIESGNPDFLTTQLGRTDTGEFKPYGQSIQNLPLYYVYKLTPEYIPDRFENVDKFVEILNQQSIDNEYVHNYVRLASDSMIEYLKESGITDENTVYLKIDRTSLLTDLFYSNFESVSTVDEPVIEVKETFNEGDLSVAEDAPEKIKTHIEDILSQLQRVDRSMTLDDVSLNEKYYRYISGFVYVDVDKISETVPRGTTIVLVNDLFKYASFILEAKRSLESIGYTVVCAVNLAKIEE